MESGCELAVHLKPMNPEIRKNMRSRLSQDLCSIGASVFDPISARIAEDLEFDFGIMAGSVASMVITGAPDLALVSLGELAEQVRRTCRASNLPILIDADHGFGNALHVMRTVEELEAAGAAAITIEDTLLPGIFGVSESGMISKDEMVGKLNAAIEARRDPGFLIVARTSAVAIGGLENALERLKTYDSLGVDGLLLVGVKSKEELDAIAECTTLPIILGGCSSEVTELEYARSRRVKHVVPGIQPHLASVQGVYSALSALRRGDLPDGLPSKELMEKVTRANNYAKWSSDFLSHKR